MPASPTVRLPTWLPSPLGRLVVAGTLSKTGTALQARDRVLGSYGLVLVTRGAGRYSDANGRVSVVTAGDVLVLFPELRHSYGPEPAGSWEESFVVFEGPVFDLWREAGLLDPATPVRRAPGDPAWRRRVGDLVRPATRRQAGGLRELCQVQQVLAGICDLTPQSAGGGDLDAAWLERAQHLLRADERRERPLEDVAAELSLSYDGFRKRFRSLAGMSPARFRSLASIDRACELMVSSTMSDREIAAQLGYGDESHFSHRFRALVGRSPRAFRAALQH